MRPISFNNDWTYMPGQSTMWFILGRGRGENPVPVTLPHDATVHEVRAPGDRTTMGKGGYPNGGYVYRKKFFVPAEWAEKRVTLEFEGVYMNAMVYLNGDFAGQCPNGYAGFAIPCNGLLNYGAENEIRVMCSGDQDSRWYVKNPKLWDLDEPNLYRVEVSVTENGAVVDESVVETIVYTNGVETGRYSVETADESVELCVNVDQQSDLSFVEISLRDAQGRLNPGAVRKVSVSVEGAGVLQGLGSGNCCTDENFFDPSYNTYFGHALAAIRPTGSGEITVTISAEGCETVTRAFTA